MVDEGSRNHTDPELEQEQRSEAGQARGGLGEIDIDEALQALSEGKVSEEQEKLLEKVDKESATRKLASPTLNRIFYILCIIVTLYHVYTVVFVPPVTFKHRSMHVAMMLVLAFIMYPRGKNSSRKSVAWYD